MCVLCAVICELTILRFSCVYCVNRLQDGQQVFLYNTVGQQDIPTDMATARVMAHLSQQMVEDADNAARERDFSGLHRQMITVGGRQIRMCEQKYDDGHACEHYRHKVNHHSYIELAYRVCPHNRPEVKFMSSKLVYFRPQQQQPDGERETRGKDEERLYEVNMGEVLIDWPELQNGTFMSRARVAC